MDENIWESKYKELEAECRKLKRQNELLRECEQIYRVAMGMTKNTITIIDIPKRTLNQIYNDGILDGEWDGVQQSMENAPESIIATGIIHPEDCQKYRGFYDEIYAGKPYVECMIRVMGETQGWVWFKMYSKTIFDDDDQKPLRAIVFSEDITAKKIAEIQYQSYREVVVERADFFWEANLTQDRLIQEAEETEFFFADIRSVRPMTVPPPWTGWLRSRSAASPSPPPPPPATGRAPRTSSPRPASTSSTPRAMWTSPSRWSAPCACWTVP